MRRALALAALALVTGCGGSDGDTAPTVFAAASLTEVFQAIDPDAQFSFAGSDELATQIREGGPVDVYAAASPRYPDELFEEGLIEKPVIFATNRLVLVVPSDNPAGIESVEDLGEDGVKLVVGAEGVPVGDYTRQVLETMGATQVLDNVVSNEEDVKGVLAKVSSGQADAGFVYATDALVAGDDVTAIELPAEAQAEVRYPIGVAVDAEHAEAGRAFVEKVLGPEGRAALEEAGFGLP
jgi:molybdate transport system substrate-binding protein